MTIMKLKLLLLLLITALFHFISGYTSDQPKLSMLIFMDKDCSLCEDLLINLLPELDEQFYLEYTFYQKEEEDALFLLEEITREFGETSRYPVILVGNRLLQGLEIYTRLKETLLEFSQGDDCCIPLHYNFLNDLHNPFETAFPVYLTYIFSSESIFQPAPDSTFSTLQEEFPLLEIREFNLSTAEGREMNGNLCSKYQIPEDDVDLTPKVFIGNDLLYSEEINYDALRRLILKYKDRFNVQPWPSTGH